METTMAETNHVEVRETEPGLLHVHLNAPQQLNALSQGILQSLKIIFDQAAQDKSVKAILLSGEGKAFCAGANIKELSNLTAVEGTQFARLGQSVFRQLELMGKPSLAALHGFVLGGGCELAMAATLRIAADDTQFGQPEIKLGVIPGFGGTQRLARLIGLGRAFEICLTGKRFNAIDALQWGFVNAVVPQQELLSTAKTLLLELIQLSPIAIHNLMTSIIRGFDLPLEDGLLLEANQFGICCASKDKQEGVQAFLEKRKPKFRGE